MKRAEIDENKELLNFCVLLENSVIDTILSGKMTKDLALCIHGKEMKDEHWLATEDFKD